MKSIHALMPAALLAVAVVSGPAEAKRTMDPGTHARRMISKISKLDYFTVMNAKRLIKVRKAGSPKTKKKAAGKATKEIRKTANRKLRKKSAKPAVAIEKQKAVAVLTPAEIKPRSILAKPAVISKTRKAAPPAASNQAVIAPREMAQLDPALLSKVMRSGPRVRRKSMPGRGLQAGGPTRAWVASIIREMAPSYGVPTWFALRIAHVESGYNPYAHGRAGEIGVYQLKCQTARGMGFEGKCFQLTDARTNVIWGLKHLSLAIASSGGNLKLAASKHNAGLRRKSLVHSYISKVF
ncbi:transglycosylase SLT domain-containing protein [Taklimakanibacter lacteus]|uniref:transglycosylase SLT domain-containing protein n=1 Tax=Taklimakanibacter lacteus TaxID=2268456 RepID=UPI000E664C67